MSTKFQRLEELALANVLRLFDLWRLDYKKVNEDEYDFINPNREDNNFGACRFNIKKNRGADFAGHNFSDKDIKSLGLNFTKEDFLYNPNTNTNWGFTIIGLCQRIHKIKTYVEAAKLLEKHLLFLNQTDSLEKITEETIQARLHKQQEDAYKKLLYAERTWNNCKPIDGTIAEIYLQSRYIFLDDSEPNIRYHPKVFNQEAQGYFPALLCKVSPTPEAPLQAIHRIFLRPDGKAKAPVNNPKLALGSVKKGAIWLGTPNETLNIAEGPENAAVLRVLHKDFVCSTINSANFGGLILPPYVKKVNLYPDPDKAGLEAAKKAQINYLQQGKEVKVVWPPKLRNGGIGDWCDVLKDRGVNG